MRCIMCGGHATFDQTVFRGTSPTKIRLCEPCASKVDASEHLARIKGAADREAKDAAVAEFLRAVGK